MKIAVLWGVAFGILEAIIGLAFSINFTSLSSATVLWVTILALALYVACGLLCTVKAKAFSVGIQAGLIAVTIDVVSGLLIGIVNNPMPRVGLVFSVVYFVLRIVLRMFLTAVGAGIGILIYRKITKPA